MREERAALSKKSIILKSLVFVLICLLLVAGGSVLMRPAFVTGFGNNSQTIRGLYHVPENSVDTVFLGTSSMLSAVAPVQLYEETGLQSYNLATRSQPLLVSYYLLEEAYRLNPESLKTVVIDPVKMFDEEMSSAKAKESLLLMDPSLVKLRALVDASQRYEDFELLDNLVPVFGYHSRWNNLKTDDYRYVVQGDSSLDFTSHGYFPGYGSIRNPATQETSWQSHGGFTDELDAADQNYDERLARDLDYFERIVAFCRDKGLDLVVLRLPRLEWDDFSHDALTYLTDKNGVDCVDMNLPEVRGQLGFDYSVDYTDTKHPNVQGSAKITSYVGRLLRQRVSAQSEAATDAQATQAADSGFTAEDVAARAQQMKNSRLYGCSDLGEYLDLVSDPAYTVFLVTRGDRVQISDDIAAKMRGVGLDSLASLKQGSYYVGVMSGGKGIRGFAETDYVEAWYRASFDGKELIVGDRAMQTGAVLDNPVTLQAGPEASISVLGYERCVQADGVCMVVFDTHTGTLIDSSCFALEAPYERVPVAIPSGEATQDLAG